MDESTLVEAPAPAPARGDSRSARIWVLYVVKAALAGALLVAFSQVSAQIPAWGVGLFWAVLGLFASFWLAYRWVVRKEIGSTAFQEGGMLFRFAAGRVLCVLVSFVLASAATAGLLLDVPGWDAPQWAAAASAIPVFFGAYLLFDRKLQGEVKEPYRVAKTTMLAWAATFGLLCVVYGLIQWFGPASSYGSVVDVVNDLSSSFEGSPSALMGNAGVLCAFFDGIFDYWLSAVTAQAKPLYIVAKILVGASAMAGIAGLAASCSLGMPELRRVLSRSCDPGCQPRVSGRCVALIVCLPLALSAAFTACDTALAGQEDGDEAHLAHEWIRDHEQMLVAVIDGSLYAYDQAQTLLQEISQIDLERTQLGSQAAEALVPLVNAAFDTQVANVDAYLDWYFNMFSDYEILGGMVADAVTGSAEDYVQRKLEETLSQGVNESELYETLQYYVDQDSALAQARDEAAAALEDCKVEDVPDWFLTKVPVAFPASSQADGSHQKTVLDAAARIGVGAMSGVAAGLLTKNLVTKIAEKSVYKAIVEKVLVRLGVKGTESATRLFGPIAVAVGTAAGLGVDWALVAVDEMQHREEYRSEMVEVIEAERAEWLSALGVDVE